MQGSQYICREKTFNPFQVLSFISYGIRAVKDLSYEKKRAEKGNKEVLSSENEGSNDDPFVIHHFDDPTAVWPHLSTSHRRHLRCACHDNGAALKEQAWVC